MSPKGFDGSLPLEFTFDFNASGESSIRFPVEDGGLPPLSQVRSRFYKIQGTYYFPDQSDNENLVLHFT
jgi:hypothetical protein